MNLWTAIVIIVAIAAFSGIYRARFKSESKKTDEDFENLSQRISRLEDRIANLETIVLEKERTRQFSDL